MANIIITDSALIAIHVAAALGGIRVKKGQITYDDIPNQTDRLNAMATGSKKFFRTTYKGSVCYVTWISTDPILEAKPKEQPKLFHYKTYKLKKSDLEHLTCEEFKKEKIQNVYFALSNTERTNIARTIIPRSIKAEEYYDVLLPGLNKELIQNAFASAQRIGKTINTQEAIQRDVNRTNARNEISKRVETETLDQYELAALSIIKRHNALSKAGKKAFHIQGKSQIHGIPCTVTGRKIHTKEEAEQLLQSFPQYIVLDKAFEEGYKDGFLTTPDLFSFPGVEVIEDVGKVAFELYEKGLISPPYSNCPYLPMSFKRTNETEIVQACIDWTNEETIKKSIAISAIQQTKKRDLVETGIIPYTANGKDHLVSNLSDEAKSLYTSIIKKTDAAIKQNVIESFKFLAGEYPLYCVVNIDEIKSTLKVNEHIGASFAIEEIKDKSTFRPIHLDEVFHQMQEKPIGNGSIYFEVSRSLRQKGLIRVVSGGETFLTEKGEEIFSKVPAGKDFLILCSSWDLDVKKEVLAEWPIKASKALTEQLDKDFFTLNGKNIIHPSPPKEEMEESAIEAVPGGCPICNQDLLTTKDSFKCAKCDFEIQKNFEMDGYKTIISQKDLTALKDNGRTSGKVFTSTDATITGYIVIKDGKVNITNETTYSCPACGKPLFIFDWGFGCGSCEYAVPFKVNGTKLTSKDLKALLLGSHTDPIESLGGSIRIVKGKPVIVK